MSQNHFTLSFPLKSPADANLLAGQIPPMMPKLFQANDMIGTVHQLTFHAAERKDSAVSRRLRRRIRSA
jgi:hypothetical protein